MILPLNYRILFSNGRFLLQRDERAFSDISEDEKDERARRYFETISSVGITAISKSAAFQTEPRDQAGKWTMESAATPSKPPRIHPGAIMPRTGFSGVRGHSEWISEDATTRTTVLALTGGRAVRFKNGFPDFKPFVPLIGGLKARVHIPLQNDRDKDFSLADRALAQKLGWMNARGKPDSARARTLRKTKRLTWHHIERPCGAMELVPTDLHNAVSHSGGFSLCSQ